jgi:hypothetical protein
VFARTSITRWSKTAGAEYAPGDSELEKDAREAKNMVWADPQPVPPWEWRKRQDIGEGGIVLEGKVRSATG